MKRPVGGSTHLMVIVIVLFNNSLRNHETEVFTIFLGYRPYKWGIASGQMVFSEVFEA